MSDQDDVLDLRIERLIATGAGLARSDGGVVFVEGALPGDRVRARVVRRAKRHVEAVVEEVLEPSPDRRAARCAHFGACGGCSLQHLAYPAQLAAKRNFVLDALRSIASIVPEFEVEVIGSPEYGWRSRAELQLEHAGGRTTFGAFRTRSHEVVALRECPVLVPELEAIVTAAAGGRTGIPGSARQAFLAAGDRTTAIELVDADGRTVDEPGSVVQRVDGFDLEFGARTFFQGNRALLPALVARATAPRAAKLGARGALAFDLYAGSGLFSLPLARSFDLVLAVEEDKAAVERLRANVAAAELTRVRAEVADVARWITRASRLGPEFILLDPPRAGAGPDVVDGIAAAKPREVRYVACDPATLARDLRRFQERNYLLRALSVLDIFPQTLHVESVATLLRAD